jgi:tRNA(Ile)-lysidine synthase
MADCRRAIAEFAENHFLTATSVLVAVSGGADSLALAWASGFVLPRAGHTLHAVIVDHGLQADSAEVAKQALHQVESFGVPGTITRVEVDGSGNVEDNARVARYDALERVASKQGAGAVFLGHTLDDQAETVLLGLARGSGPASIRGMSPVRGLWCRPFLQIPRQMTRQACQDAGIVVWDDPHNVDRRFLRPQIRHDVMPVLESVLGPGVSQALATTADLIAADDDYLIEVAEGVFALALTDLGELDVTALEPLHPAIRTRVLRMFVTRGLGASPTKVQTDMIDALIVSWKGQGPVDIAGHKLGRNDNTLRIL